MKALCKALQENQEWLEERVRAYALEQGYAARGPAGRISVSGLAGALARTVAQHSSSLGFGPDAASGGDPASGFALQEARSHRERGDSLALLLGQFKCFRRACLDLAEEKVSRSGRKRAGEAVARFFDRVEMVVVREWPAREEAGEELHSAYRAADIQNRIAEVLLTVSGEEMYSRVLQVLLEATGSRFGIFAYQDEEGAVVLPSMTRDVWEACRMPDKATRFPQSTWGGSLWSRAIREKRLLVKNEPGVTPEGHVPIHCSMAAPILFHDEVIGHFEFANRQGGYTAAEEDIVAEACRRIAPVLHARLEQERTEAERGLAEAELRESRMMLRQVLDSVPQSIFWKNANGEYLGCNQVFARAGGLSGPDEIVGKTDFDLPWPRADAEAYRADDAEVLASRKPKLHILEPLQQADGSRLWIDTSKKIGRAHV